MKQPSPGNAQDSYESLTNYLIGWFCFAEVNGEIQCHWAEEEFCKCPCDSSRYIYKIRKASFVGGISNVVEIDATITVIENCEKEKILIWTWRNENVPSTSNDWCSLDADYFYAKLAKITLEKLEKKLRKCDEDPCPLGAAPPPAADSAPPPAADSAQLILAYICMDKQK